MTLCRPLSRSKPQSIEDRIGGGAIGLIPDPSLNRGQPLGRLMDVVALGDVGDGVEQQRDAALSFVHRLGGVSRIGDRGARPIGRSFSIFRTQVAFPRGIPASDPESSPRRLSFRREKAPESCMPRIKFPRTFKLDR